MSSRGDVAALEDSLERLSAIGRDGIAARVRAAELRIERGDLEEAALHLERALAMGEYPSAFATLGDRSEAEQVRQDIARVQVAP